MQSKAVRPLLRNYDAVEPFQGVFSPKITAVMEQGCHCGSYIGEKGDLLCMGEPFIKTRGSGT